MSDPRVVSFAGELGMTKQNVPLAMVLLGILTGLSYLALAISDLAQRLADVEGVRVSVMLLVVGLVLGGGSLLVYPALRRRRARMAAPIRSLGVAASLCAVLGLVVVVVAMVDGPGPASRFAIPFYALEVGLTLLALWHQTFPVTSPTGRRIVTSLLIGLPLSAPPMVALVLAADPMRIWFSILAIGWLLVLAALPVLRDRALDARAKAPKTLPGTRDGAPIA